jgi:hypothetical protein
LVSAPKKKRPPGTRAKKSRTTGEDVIKLYSERLQDAGNQRLEFESVLAAIGKDTRVKRPELNQIASRYVGVPISMDKRAAEKIIRQTFTERVRTDREFEIGLKVTPS